MNLNLSKLEKKINIKFKNSKLLIKSLTHKSYDSINNYEKLEFLGDRILGLIISIKLLETYPEDTEGALDKKLASLVNKNRCQDLYETTLLTFNALTRVSIINLINVCYVYLIRYIKIC